MAEEKKFKAVIEVGGGIGSSLKTAFATLRGNTKQLGDSLKSLEGQSKKLSHQIGKGLGGPEAARSLEVLNGQIRRTERNIKALNLVKSANVGAAVGAVGSRIKSGVLMIGTAAGAAAAGIVALGKSVGDYADNAAEAASSVGMGTNELIRYKYAADDVGTGADTLQNSIAKMQLTLEKARKDGGGNVFKLLNLDARKLSRQAPEKPLEAVTEAFSRYNGKIPKAALAMQLFGKSGAKMVNFLSLGKKGLEEYGAEAEAFGLTLDKDLIEEGDKFGRTQLRVSAAFQGMKNNLARGFLPALNELGNKFADFVKSHPEEIKEFGRKIGDALRALPGIIAKFGTAISGFIPKVEQMVEKFGGAKRVIIGLGIVLNAGLIMDVLKLGAAFAKLGWGLATLALGNPVGLVVTGVVLLGTAIYILWKNWAGVEVVFRAGMIWLGMKWDELKESVKGFGAAIEAYALGAFTGLKSKAMEVLNWIDNKLGAVGEAFGKVKGWFGGGDSAKPSNAAPVDGARANGGPVSAGKRYLVGERGPEIFAPRLSGQIIPNGGGKSDNRTFNFTINAAPGMNERTLADLVIARLNGRQAALAGGALYD
jgi:hypothetical protein